MWIHGVSVGEAMIACQLAKGMKSYKYFSNADQIIISTTTTTGQKIAKNSILQENAMTIYFPLDLSFVVRRVIRLVNPSLIILVETELWPNIITQAGRKNIPVIIVNGRISDKSYLGYKFARLFLKKFFRYVKLFCMQEKLDYERIISLGASRDKVKICGNMKFDVVDRKISKDKINRLQNWLNYKENDNIFVCGSTHPGEEENLLDIYKKLLYKKYNLKLVLAPRHVERKQELRELIESYKYYPIFFSNFTSHINYQNKSVVYILDEIGWLKPLYLICTIAFIGGSLKKYGGHNIIEPALFSKPIMFGPHMSNFRTIVSQFLNHKAAIQIKNSTELYNNCILLLSNKSLGIKLGKRAFEVVKKNQGVTKRNIHLINLFR